MRPSTQVRYSMAFKQQVVADLEAGRFGTILAAKEHYGIGGAETIRKWLQRLGRNHLIPKVVRVEKPEEADQIRQLKKQVHQLQQALGQTQLENLLNKTMLEMACLELGVDVEAFKKKADTKRSTGPGGPAGSR